MRRTLRRENLSSYKKKRHDRWNKRGQYDQKKENQAYSSYQGRGVDRELKRSHSSFFIDFFLLF